MKEETKFPARLRSAMAKKKMLQKDLCKATGINKSTLSLYVAGKRHATDYNMFLIAQALDVDIAWLMGYSDEPEAEKPVTKKQELIAKIEFLTEGECEKMINFIRDFLGK